MMRRMCPRPPSQSPWRSRRYRQLIQLRRDTAVLRAGDYRPCAADPYAYAYHRHDPTDEVLIATNFADSDCRYADPQLTTRGDRLPSSTGTRSSWDRYTVAHSRPPSSV
jgi:hypothetical protein